MAVITSYSTLVTAVQDYLARGDLSTFVPNFVQNCEQRFYRSPKNWGKWMEQSLSSTISSSVIAVPSDYLQLRVAYVNGSPSSRLEFVSLEQLYGRFPRGSDTGIPQWIARDGTNFVFGPAPDSDYTIKGSYFGKPTALRSYAGDAAAHWLILNAPDLLLYGALLEAEPFIKNDSRMAVWSAMYAAAVKDYRDMIVAEYSTMSAQEVLA